MQDQVNNNNNRLPQGLVELSVPVAPAPILEDAIEYPLSEDTPARFVSFYWEPAGDEACYDDGRFSGTGDWRGYQIYIYDRLVGPHLRGLDLGSSEQRNTHRLVLDMETRKLYAATERDARRALADQWQRPAGSEAPAPLKLSPEDLAELDKKLKEGWGKLPTEEEFQSYLARRDKALSALTLWLDEQQALAARPASK